MAVSTAAEKLATWVGHKDATRRQFQEELQAAQAASEHHLAQMSLDSSWIGKIWDPLDRRIYAANNSLRSIWSRGAAIPEAEEYRLGQAELELELDLARAFRNVRARAAQAMLSFAIAADSRTRFCTSCGANIVSRATGLAEHVPCAACGSTQLVEPGQAFRTFAHSAARWVGEWDGLPQFEAMRAAEEQIDAYRNTADVPIELLAHYDQVARSYWQTLLVTEAQLVPEKQAHLEMQLEGALRDATKRLSRHWQWRDRMPSV